MIKMKDFIIIKNVRLVSTKENKNLIDIPDLQFDKNSISVIMGHNGSGKTLLLNLLQGLITPNSGSIRFNPQIKNCKNFISIMMQNPTFLRRTTQQNIQFILDLNKNKTKIQPKKPNSSPRALNIKSVCCSGINCKEVSLAFNKPVPKNPPEPIAILLCNKWYPPPNGSLPGSKNKINLSF